MARPITKRPKSAENIRRITATAVALTPEKLEEAVKLAPVEEASACIGTLKPGGLVFGITKGQFSILDLIRACIEQTGPADLALSTWTFGIRDAETASWLVSKGHIRSLTFLVDHSFPQREAKYSQRLRELFGPECMVLSKVHAKVATIRNESWNLCISGSMNLNRNPRWEQFVLYDSPAWCDFFAGIISELRALGGAGWDSTSAEVEGAFEAAGKDATMDLVEAYERKQKPLPAVLPAIEAGEVPVPSRLVFLREEFQRLTLSLNGAMQDHAWPAVDRISRQKQAIHAELTGLADVAAPNTPAEQHAALIEQLASAPPSIHWEVWQRLSALHPEWTEADNEPGGELIPIKGGKR